MAVLGGLVRGRVLLVNQVRGMTKAGDDLVRRYLVRQYLGLGSRKYSDENH